MQLGQMQRQGQLQEQAIAENERQATESKRVSTERATIDQLMQAAYLPDGTLNREALRKGAVERGYGHLWPTLEKQLNESEKAIAELTKLQEDTKIVQRKALALKAVGVRATGYDPQAFATALAMGVQTKLIPKEEAGQLLAHIYENPALVKEWTDQVIASMPEIAKQDADIASTKANTKQTEIENQLLETTGSKTPPTSGTFGDYLTSYARDVAKKPLQALTAADKEAAKKKWEALNDKPTVTRFTSKDILDDAGNPTTANYDAVTGTYTGPDGKAIKNPKPIPSAQERMDSRKFQKAAPILSAVGELSEKINTQQGVIAKLKGAEEIAKAKVNLNDDVSEYMALVSGFTPLVARSLGHTGVLTQQDVDSVKELFPKPGDSKSLRDRKVKRLMDIVGQLEGTEGVPTKAKPSNQKIGRFDVSVEP
jgi:hypothetical protein